MLASCRDDRWSDEEVIEHSPKSVLPHLACAILYRTTRCSPLVRATDETLLCCVDLTPESRRASSGKSSGTNSSIVSVPATARPTATPPDDVG